LIKYSLSLPNTGVLRVIDDYTFLDISDAYIHELFPLLAPESNLQKPNYFSSQKSMGAHISIIYPEEQVRIERQEHAKTHVFKPTGLWYAILESKTYYVLMIESPTLTSLRRKYQLPDQLSFKGNLFSFHTTIAIRFL